MIKKMLLGICAGIFLIAILVVPVLAAYYAYINVSEDDGNNYDDLAVTCPANIDALLQGGYITTTGLDTRVLTGSGEALPHMVAEDRVLFITDLDAYEDKSLIFYTGATSLSSFPIIVGYNGNFTTPDDADLEHSMVSEVLISGLFDSSGGADRNILYKEEAYKIDADDADTLTVAWLEAGDTAQWELEYGSFTSGDHTIYVFTNGLVAYLYVDVFDVAKDTENLFDQTSYQILNKLLTDPFCFYDEGYYWVFYEYNNSNIGYVTSPDGVTWSGETTIAVSGGDSMASLDITMRGEYIYVAYRDTSGDDDIRYRRGDLTSAPGITWSAAWQTAVTETSFADSVYISVDSNGYPYIAYETTNNRGFMTKSSANDGTWVTDGGYPWQIYYSGTHPSTAMDFEYYPDSNKLLFVWVYIHASLGWQNTYARYFNGSSWESQDNISSYTTGLGAATMTADDNDNMYIGWCTTLGVGGDDPDQSVTVRYSNETYEVIDLNEDGDNTPQLCYNDNTDVLYILYGYRNGSDWVYCVTLDTIAMELNDPVQMTELLDDGPLYGVSPYEDHIGFLMDDSSNTFHNTIDLTYYTWNDNSNNWFWMQNNVMPYGDEFQMAVDGVLQLDYVPSSVIVDDTLPDEESDHDATINWGTNPTGVSASMGPLQSEESYDSSYYYQNLQPDPQDIIKPEPPVASGDVDLEGLRDNPMYPIVAIMSGTPLLTERLSWLLLAWFITIAAMFGVHLGFDRRPDTPKPQHFILTTVTGLGLSILFYSLGIFAWPVIVLMGFGLAAAIVWERQPVM